MNIGSWIQIGHPAVAEIMANAGFDWLAVDMEHTDISMPQLASLIRGIEAKGAYPYVRVRENDALAIRQALDLGAVGVIVPLVNTHEEALRAVSAAQYPPKGKRGIAFCRANAYGENFDWYVEYSTRTVQVIVMIETSIAVANIENILAVDGLDGVFIGPYDLSGSFGVPGQTSHPKVLEARQAVLNACGAAGKFAGIHIVMPDKDALAQAQADGFTFIAVGGDTIFLRRGIVK